MKLLLTVLLLTAGVFAPASSARQDAAEETSHRERDEVVVPLSAVDKEGRAVAGLKPEDVRLAYPQALLK